MGLGRCSRLHGSLNRLERSRRRLRVGLGPRGRSRARLLGLGAGCAGRMSAMGLSFNIRQAASISTASRVTYLPTRHGRMSAMGALGAPYTDLKPARTRTRTRKKSGLGQVSGPGLSGPSRPLDPTPGRLHQLDAGPAGSEDRPGPTGPNRPLGPTPGRPPQLDAGARGRGGSEGLRAPRFGPTRSSGRRQGVRRRGRFAGGGAPGPDVKGGCKSALEATARRGP